MPRFHGAERNAARIPALILLGVLLASGALAEAAVELRSGSVSRQQLIAIGRDLVVAGTAEHNAVAIQGDAEITGTIGGDLIVLGGDARLQGTARVAGDVFVLGGRVTHAEGAVVEGRTVAYPSVPRSWLILLEGPTVGLDPLSPAALGVKVALIASWLVAATVLVSAFAAPLRATAREVARQPFRSFFVGVVTVLSMVLTLLFFSAFAPPSAGVPLVLLIVLFALVLKLWGTVAVFESLGEWLTGFLRGGRRIGARPPLAAIGVGLAALGVIKLLPWVGVVVWTVVTFVGVGAALTTKLGRLEPWLEA